MYDYKFHPEAEKELGKRDKMEVYEKASERVEE